MRGPSHLADHQFTGTATAMLDQLAGVPQYKVFRGVEAFKETTRQVLEVDSRAAEMKSSKKKGKLNQQKKKLQAQLEAEYAEACQVRDRLRRKEKFASYAVSILMPIFLIYNYGGSRQSAPLLPRLSRCFAHHAIVGIWLTMRRTAGPFVEGWATTGCCSTLQSSCR